MPVVGRGNRHRVDALILKHPAHVAVLGRLGRLGLGQRGLGFFARGLIDVAQPGYPDVVNADVAAQVV